MITALALSFAAASGVHAATTARTPTPSERTSLTKALVNLQGPTAHVEEIRVSGVDARYTDVRWSLGSKGTAWVSMFHRVGSTWRVTYNRQSNQPATGACAYAPAAVVRDLTGVSCPSFRALHARKASRAELQALHAAFLRAPAFHEVARTARLGNGCISRLSPAWAGVLVSLPTTGYVVWFHRAGGGAWRVAYESLHGSGKRPAKSIVLSLASCVGYNAAAFGG